MESPTLPRTVLPVPPSPQRLDHQFSILQWNVLADGLAQFGEFTRADAQHLQWEQRAPLILQELSLADADIICLQEVNHFGTPIDFRLQRITTSSRRLVTA